MSHGKCEKFVDPSATIGDDTTVWHYTRVLQNVRIGKCCSIGGGCEIGRGSIIGDYSRIGANVFLPPHSVIGDRVFVGPGVLCADDMHPKVPADGEGPYHAQPPMIDDDASIGIGVILLPGIRIGKRARIAAGALVTRDVPDDGFVKSQPARPGEMPAAWRDRDPIVDGRLVDGRRPQ